MSADDPKLHVPTDSAARKDVPLCTGVFDYFPDALVAVAELSKKGNDKHNPGQPLHWAKEKSNDHADCIARHLLDRGTIDPEDNVRHSTKVAWRALAMLQIEIENSRGPVAELERRACVPAATRPNDDDIAAQAYWDSLAGTPGPNYKMIEKTGLNWCATCGVWSHKDNFAPGAFHYHGQGKR